MAQELRALALAEDLGSTPSIHIMAHSHLPNPVPGDSARHIVGAHTYMQAIHSYT